jgi:isopentenyl phosphate kinase
MKDRPFRLLVVHGAGPFGHVNVKDYDINDGLESPRDFEGLSKTNCDCTYLNWAVSDNLRKEGLVTYPFPTSSVVVQDKKRIVDFNIDPVRKLWNSNEDIVPVMNGIMVPDLHLKASVISGDGVIEYLGARLKPKLVVFATDVDGIYDSDPRSNRRAKLISTVSKDSYGEVRAGLSGSKGVDVTGGMLGKMERLLGMNVRTLIVNGNVPGRVRNALLGKPVKSTEILPDRKPA